MRLRVGTAPGWLVYLRTMGLFSLAWYGAASLASNRLLLPSPGAVAQALWRVGKDGELLVHVATSSGRLLLSVAVAIVLAVPLGAAMGLSKVADYLLDLPVELLRPIAGIAWIPLALFIFGIGHRLPMFIMFYTAFFPLVLGTAVGIRQVDRRLLAAASTMGLSGLVQLHRVVFPAALPSIMVALRLAVAAAWTAVVAAELVGAPSGLGYAIQYYRSMLATPEVIAYIAVIGFLGFLTDALLRASERRLVPWAHTEGDR